MSIVYKITSFFIAIVVLCSTMAFTIDMHYCGDTLVDAAIFQKATTCGMEKSTSESISGFSVSKKKCCHDQQIVVEGQDELQFSLYTISFEQQLFITSFVYAYNILFDRLEKVVFRYDQYVPSLVIRQLYKIDQSYLI